MIETTKINPVEIETKIVDAQGNELVPVRHGHWVYDKTPMFGNPYGSYICSICFPYAQAHKTNYCPNCGAKMDEVREDVKIN